MFKVNNKSVGKTSLTPFSSAPVSAGQLLKINNKVTTVIFMDWSFMDKPAQIQQ